MTASELRKKYLEFFQSKGHAVISGKSLIPENDPTVLFNTAGMQPLVPYLLGAAHPLGTRLTDVQKCVRTGDIESVGDPSHLTFFEMLGNWSLGDYFKNEALSWSFEFLTSPRWLGISPDKLWVTVFAGEDGIPRDEESADLWKSLGIPAHRISYLGRKDNWWGPAGQTGPCGPDSEMFYDTGRPCPKGEACEGPSCGCGRWLEIWNDVFMQYNKTAEGQYELLSKPNVDTGMGVERTSTILQGKKSVYETELFTPILAAVQKATGVTYGNSDGDDTNIRIICDHIKTACFILGDDLGVTPSNVGQGYVLRRLIRRAVRCGRKLGVLEPFLAGPAAAVLDIYRGVYDEVASRSALIFEELTREEEKFLKTLEHGEHEFEKMLPNLERNPKKEIPGRLAFKLYDTYGFPIEITEELAAEHGMTVDRPGFDEAFVKHQELSKAGADKTFKGGLADHSEMTTKLHTATHLMHKALQMVLGEHARQKGSNITPERLRFDFSHGEKMTEEQLRRVEAIVNEQIQRALPVSMTTMPIQEAKGLGAMALFGEKYEDVVKVYRIGDFSLEVCGGPHVENTGSLGHFRILKEEASSAGVRRIRAVLEDR
ncbi:MAG: alanine--tRNA ligase [Spirochaetales bacterium]|nr:alanine--tRNA ligase [Spirochaetales bacterium]